MKQYSIFALLLVILAACDNSPEGFRINGTLGGDVKDGTQVFLKRTDERNQPIDVDTASITGGEFSFSGDATLPELHYLFVDQMRGNIPLIIEKGTIEVKAQKDSLAYAEIDGTLQNELFSDFLESSRALSRKALSMNEDMMEASSKRDTAVMNSLREEYFELQEEAKSFELEYARNNPNALISALIIDKAHSTGSLPEGQVKELYEALSDEIKNTEAGKKLKEKIDAIGNTSIGAKAPDFEAPTPNGESLALSDVLGKVTIVDFWAAWCKPCRAENPNVVKVYNKYRDQGLSILGVSLDKSEEDWKRAIEEDGLAWNHVSNVRYFDEIAQLYNVNAIPATFILDEDGVIVAKNLRGSELDKKVGELLLQ